LPDVTPLDVVLVRAEHDRRPVGAHGHVLDLERSRREQRGPTAVDRDRVEVCPAILLPGEHDAVARCPPELILRDHFTEHAAGPRVGDPHRRPVPLATSATRIDHGWPARWGVNGSPSAPAGVRRNATYRPSGD